MGEAACKKDKDLTINTNIEATKNLVNFSLENKVKRFIFLSTCSSYGVQSTDQMANEETPLNPISLYGKTKVEAEKILMKELEIDLKSDALDPEQTFMREQKIQIMHEVVKTLKPRYRTLVELRYFKEYSYEEIAEHLDIPLGTVKAQLFRAREFLYNIMSNTHEKI